jgi:D-alanyl-lipoteichoic acid acyltransferase DltB (MBOAT superfamily)
VNFASWTFVLLFLPLALLVFRFAGGQRRNALIVLSFGFYLWSGPWNALVLAASMAANATIGHLLTRPDQTARYRMTALWVGIAANVGLLFAFKVAALDLGNGDGFRTSETILIPLALSFVTFHQIWFLTACHKRQVKGFLLGDYVFFITFFPQLVMGPIVRFQDIARQLKANALARVSAEDVAVGLAIFSFGLAQKVLLADQIGAPVDTIFAAAQTNPVTPGEAWFAIIGFQLQLFFDFCGYADMAIGLARMFGMNLPINFDRPLFARDRFDVWRRWHITFAIFMRSHVFTPLARQWRWPIPLALAASGILSGLWHGLGITFVLWGLITTAVMLLTHWRRTRTRDAQPGTLGVIRMIAFTFLTSALIGALFRSPTLEAAHNIYGALAFIVQPLEGTTPLGGRALVMLPLCTLIAWGLPNSAQWFRRYWTALDPRPGASPPPVHWTERFAAFRLTPFWGLMVATLLIGSLAVLGDPRRFVYVQF